MVELFFAFSISVRIESRDMLLPLTGGGFVAAAEVDFLEKVELWYIGLLPEVGVGSLLV